MPTKRLIKESDQNKKPPLTPKQVRLVWLSLIIGGSGLIWIYMSFFTCGRFDESLCNLSKLNGDPNYRACRCVGK